MFADLKPVLLQLQQKMARQVLAQPAVAKTLLHGGTGNALHVSKDSKEEASTG